MAEYDPLVSEAARRRKALPSYDGYTFEPGDDKWLAPIRVELLSDKSGRPKIAWHREQFPYNPQVRGRRSATWGVREVGDDGKLFDRFLRLSRPGKARLMLGEREPELALQFVKRYGVPPLPAAPIAGVRRRQPGQTADGLYSFTLDPLPVYSLCRYSAEVRAILTLASRLEKEQGQDPERRAVLVAAVNQLLDEGGVRPSLDWPGDGPKTVSLTTDFLMGAIARHVFLTVTRQRGVALCDGCGEIFVPERRKPKRGQHTWCRKCGKEGGYRAAKRISRRKSTEVV